MNKLILASIFMLFSVDAFSAPLQQPSTYENLVKNTKREEFLKYYINTVSPNKCNSVTKYIKLSENIAVTHLQVSCDNIADDFHIILTKRSNAKPVVESCTEAAKLYKANAKCKSKLK